MKKLKVNLHITEKCNYQCRYCFAHFGNRNDLSLSAWRKIVDNISDSGLVDAINFAGGEPLLYSDFVPLFLLCHGRGFVLSIISNGSLLQNGKLFPSSLFAMLDTLGISIDSFSADTLRSLGCCTRSGKVLSRQDLQAILRLALSINPNLKVKINTVVSSINANETFPDFAHEIVLDRWKFLKIKPFSGSGKDNQSLLVSDDQFDAFCQHNMPKTGIGIAEREMKNSYIIIDNQGNLLDSSSLSYSVVGNLLEEPFEDILNRFAFDKKEYEQRYGKKKETDFFDSSSSEKHDF